MSNEQQIRALCEEGIASDQKCYRDRDTGYSGHGLETRRPYPRHKEINYESLTRWNQRTMA